MSFFENQDPEKVLGHQHPSELDSRFSSRARFEFELRDIESTPNLGVSYIVFQETIYFLKISWPRNPVSLNITLKQN